MGTAESNMRKKRIGVVLSNKMQKTVVVRVERVLRHPLVGKTIRKFTRLKAHDEKKECQVGDKVLIAETRPLSREKCWRVVEIMERAKHGVKQEENKELA